jgi:hypothetical protein
LGALLDMQSGFVAYRLSNAPLELPGVRSMPRTI